MDSIQKSRRESILSSNNKLCVDCIHHIDKVERFIFFSDRHIDTCNSPHLMSIVNGEIDNKTCAYERSIGGDCGMEGVFFEESRP